MSVVENQCNYVVVRCGSAEWQVAAQADNYVDHAKHVAQNLMLPNGYQIPIWQRDRDFHIGMSETIALNDFGLIRYWDDNNGALGYIPCASANNTNFADVSEHAVFIDSKIFVLDPDNQNAFWCECRDEVSFAEAGSDMAAFKMSYGTGYFHKLRIDRVVIQRKREWHLMINGVDEVVETESDTFDFASPAAPLILCWPVVPSLAIPLDPEIIEFGFYDINEGGPDEALVRAEREGGKDYYYPDWLQAMGQDRTMDIADASDRFSTYFMNEYPAPLRQDFYCPSLPHGEVRGNIVRDGDGNVLVSVKAGTVVNRLYGASGNQIALPEIMAGDNLRLYGIGLI